MRDRLDEVSFLSGGWKMSQECEVWCSLLSLLQKFVMRHHGDALLMTRKTGGVTEERHFNPPIVLPSSFLMIPVPVEEKEVSRTTQIGPVNACDAVQPIRAR